MKIVQEIEELIDFFRSNGVPNIDNLKNSNTLSSSSVDDFDVLEELRRLAGGEELSTKAAEKMKELRNQNVDSKFTPIKKVGTPVLPVGRATPIVRPSSSLPSTLKQPVLPVKTPNSVDTGEFDIDLETGEPIVRPSSSLPSTLKQPVLPVKTPNSVDTGEFDIDLETGEPIVRPSSSLPSTLKQPVLPVKTPNSVDTGEFDIDLETGEPIAITTVPNVTPDIKKSNNTRTILRPRSTPGVLLPADDDVVEEISPADEIEEIEEILPANAVVKEDNSDLNLDLTPTKEELEIEIKIRQERLDKKNKKKIIDTNHSLPTELDIKLPSLPVTPNTPLANPAIKINRHVLLSNIKKVSTLYSKLVKLHTKIEVLDKIEDEELEDIKERALHAYTETYDYIVKEAADTFPKKLEDYGTFCSSYLKSLLSNIDSEGNKTDKLRFDSKASSYTRFVKMDDNSITYTYNIILRHVEGDNHFKFPEYVIVISQKYFADTEKDKFYITRLLKHSVIHSVGKEFNSSKNMIRLLIAILDHDQIRSDVDRLLIPFSEKDLSNKFVHDLVKKVTIDTENEKIIITINDEGLDEGLALAETNALIPDFIKNLEAIINHNNIAIKYALKTSPLRIEFILITKIKSEDIINKSQLLDMKERYDLNTETYNALVKFFVLGH